MQATSRVRPGPSREYVGGTRGDSAIVVRVGTAVASAFGAWGLGGAARGTAHDKLIETESDEEEPVECTTRSRVG
ncbi:hypothetical protein B1L11_29755 [Microbispora sp. GKU 823]|nr:hypothetical protein B1L11_29755 [Microbispora sp. GKU 823]